MQEPVNNRPSPDASPQFSVGVFVFEDHTAQARPDYSTTQVSPCCLSTRTYDRPSDTDTKSGLYIDPTPSSNAPLTTMPPHPNPRFGPPPSASVSTSTSTSTNASRALFSQTLSRRPTSTTSSNPFSAAPTVQVRSDDASNDIIERDEHGNPKFSGVPALRLEPMEDARALQKADDRVIEEYFRDCRERDRANGMEPPEEVKAALQRSLREKAASLDDDAWMFEGGDRPRRKLLF